MQLRRKNARRQQLKQKVNRIKILEKLKRKWLRLQRIRNFEAALKETEDVEHQNWRKEEKSKLFAPHSSVATSEVHGNATNASSKLSDGAPTLRSEPAVQVASEDIHVPGLDREVQQGLLQAGVDLSKYISGASEESLSQSSEEDVGGLEDSKPAHLRDIVSELNSATDRPMDTESSVFGSLRRTSIPTVSLAPHPERDEELLNEADEDEIDAAQLELRRQCARALTQLSWEETERPRLLKQVCSLAESPSISTSTSMAFLASRCAGSTGCATSSITIRPSALL